MQLWLISDTHFGHENIYRVPFRDAEGQPIRGAFANATEADGFMVEMWNKLVASSDHVYHLGDVALNQKYLDVLRLLPGHKRLVRGNHDIFKTRLYLEHFEEIYGVRVIDNVILSHVPVHPESINRRWLGNVHGHLHSGRVMTHDESITDWERTETPDPRYLNVCVEHTEFMPIAWEEVKARLRGLEKLEEE